MVELGNVNAQLHQQEAAAAKAKACKAEGKEEVEEEEEVTARMDSGGCLLLMKGVRHLSDMGITRLPDRYVLPEPQRPGSGGGDGGGGSRVKLPVVDLGSLRDPSQRAAVLGTLDAACREYGFFQVVNHGLGSEVTGGMLDVARRFFELPLPERARYMSADVRAPVRYGTSFNQANDAVLCWRDFLKLLVVDQQQWWPQEPSDLRDVASRYAAATHGVFMEIMDALLLGLLGSSSAAAVLGSPSHQQMMTVNCYPACPQPELTLGMPPHSDYGLLTLVLQQDHVDGLQVFHAGTCSWLSVQPIPGAFVVNVGDQLEIYSNGRYKSVLHRVRVNSTRPRMSVASFHSLPAERVVAPAPELVDEEAGGSPRRYMDTDFATFLDYLASADGNNKTFLQSRKLPVPAAASSLL